MLALSMSHVCRAHIHTRTRIAAMDRGNLTGSGGRDGGRVTDLSLSDIKQEFPREYTRLIGSSAESAHRRSKEDNGRFEDDNKKGCIVGVIVTNGGD